MDIFYEESAVCSDAVKAQRRYTVLHVISRICLILGIICLVFALTNIPFGTLDGNLTPEQQEEVLVYKNFFI